MKVRPALSSDLTRIMEIYAAAKAYMDRSGNPTQWNGYPSEDLVKEDIALGRNYVCEGQHGVCGVFVFIIGEDETYAYIEQGAWRRNDTYGTIHRLAADGSEKGVFLACLDLCRSQNPYLRADTHHDNKTMQHLLTKHGFRESGIIYVDDGSPRIAYEFEA